MQADHKDSKNVPPEKKMSESPPKANALPTANPKPNLSAPQKAETSPRYTAAHRLIVVWSRFVSMVGTGLAGIVGALHPEGFFGEICLDALKGAIGGAIVGAVIGAGRSLGGGA